VVFSELRSIYALVPLGEGAAAVGAALGEGTAAVGEPLAFGLVFSAKATQSASDALLTALGNGLPENAAMMKLAESDCHGFLIYSR
jgi:hypothetical protein